MRIHILGICGTFMAGVGVLAKQLGHEVSGSDASVYPPMSEQLEQQGIQLNQGYDPAHLQPHPDIVIIGNAMSRGNPAVEYVLREGLPYISGPQWLAENVLPGRWVIAVSGTHGKTTTASMVAWILQYAQLNPGFLIGGMPCNFDVSARLGESPFFIIEADEYDSAFFDKRPKFIHYHPRTLILNNLEFDHADIFTDLAAIQQQFHYLLRTVPDNGLLVHPAKDSNLAQVFQQGCWTASEGFDLALGTAQWGVKDAASDGSQFTVTFDGESQGQVEWTLLGDHNMNNALAAIAAARHAGVPVAHGCAALSQFRNVKRRMEVKGEVRGIRVYDDFAHHPTAIAMTVDGLRKRVGSQRIFAILELGSYTMRQGVHRDSLPAALDSADHIFLLQPEDAGWQVKDILVDFNQPAESYADVSDIISAIAPQARQGDHILVMSNKGFDGIHERLLTALADANE